MSSTEAVYEIALAGFLLARITEDEAMVPERYRADGYGTGFNGDVVAVDVDCLRWLAECEAKRRIVDRYTYLAEYGDPGDARWVLPLLALPYANHPDHRPEWIPNGCANPRGGTRT